jgi:hypothetical protein
LPPSPERGSPYTAAGRSVLQGIMKNVIGNKPKDRYIKSYLHATDITHKYY